MTGYCEVDDVGSVLQSDLAGANPATGEVEDAILGQTNWIRRRTNRHWYDSSGSTAGLIPTSPRSVSEIRLDVPSGPHAQDRQIRRGESATRYPTTVAGPYAKIRLPHYDVQELTRLEVRDRDGGVTDWVAASDKVAGRGEDYYLGTETDERGTSHLYVRAASIGPRIDYSELLTLAYDYGRDGVTETVRRAVALRAAAELVIDDEFEAALPNDTPAVNVQTKADQYQSRADELLDPYLEMPIA